MRIVTFGEIMLRLSPEGALRLFQGDRMEISFGGAEANVAISLAEFGAEALHVTRLPDQAVGRSAIRTLHSLGVDTSGICLGGERMGLYFQENGLGVREGVCIYDRAHSAFSQASAADFDWGRLLSGADWFHFSGVTPALSSDLADICLDACRCAHAHGLRVSCDLNYREKLWPLSRAQTVMSRLCSEVDVCIANESELSGLFGIDPPGSCGKKRYRTMAEEACARFGFNQVALTLYTPVTYSEDIWAGMLYDHGEAYFSPAYRLQMTERVGIGDSFGAGLIYSMMNHNPSQEAIDFATAASAIKHSVKGDFNRVSAEEVARLSARMKNSPTV